MIPSEVTILCWSEPESEDLNLAKLAEFLGLKSSLLRINTGSAGVGYLERNLPEHPACLAVSGTTLARIFSGSNSDNELRSFLLRRVSHLLIYATEPSQSCGAALSYLTEGAVTSIAPVQNPESKYEISPKHREVCRQLTGLTFGRTNERTDLTFAGRQDNLSSLIKIGDRTFFAALERHTCSIFIVGCNTVADIDTVVSPLADVGSYFSRLIPAMMFLKRVFRDKAWHARKPYANFTVDDPLLQESYGFLNYRTLLQTMDRCGFFTTIAFIPWNFKRTDPKIAALLRSRPDRFSIAVHGCDHTGAEFGSDDTTLLNRKVRAALLQMNDHQQTTGLAFDRVMIFPQGKFAAAAMKTLKANNFVAAANSPSVPSGRAAGPVRLRDLLDVAMLNYESFPLFLRRYPRDLFHCALDLFLEKPLLLLEHHGYFRKGYDDIAEFVSRINSLDENLSWHGLGHVIEHSVLSKIGSGPDLQMKLYSHGACVANTSGQGTTCVMSKADSGNLGFEAVTLSGKPVPFIVESGAVNLSVHVDDGAKVRLEMMFKNPWDGLDSGSRMPEHVTAFVRRRLSEMRDNYLSKHEPLLSFAYRVKDLLVGPQR